MASDKPSSKLPKPGEGCCSGEGCCLSCKHCFALVQAQRLPSRLNRRKNIPPAGSVQAKPQTEQRLDEWFMDLHIQGYAAPLPPALGSLLPSTKYTVWLSLWRSPGRSLCDEGKLPRLFSRRQVSKNFPPTGSGQS